MGDLRHQHVGPTYLYTQHPTSVIHSSRRRTSERVTPLGQFPASLSLQGRSQLQLPPHHLGQPPTLLLLNPRLQLSPRDDINSAALLAPLPAIKVSRHSQSPTTDRDSTHPAVKTTITQTTAPRRQLDGNNGAGNGVHSSAPSMTSNGVHTMENKQGEAGPVASFPQRQRPSFVSQHSNSVPSTPLQLARQYESRSRSPSPNGGLGSHSPRSVSSEANGPMPTLRKPQPRGCKYETNAAFGRRRIPYTSSDILEKPKEEPKKTLDPHEDDKLTGDMRELYDRLLPTDESADRRSTFVKKLENILYTEWPGNEFMVHVFGSSGNLLYTNESDVDICIQTPMKRLEEMHMLAEALAKYGMERVVCIPGAKVKIVKVWDPELKLACDMNVNNTLALENTRMIKTYVQIDDRVRRLAMIVKYWTKQRILNDAALGGTISSYTWICMILNFLQTRDPPIIPALHALGDLYRTSTKSDFADDLDKLRGFGDKNQETLGQLLFQFFRRYGYEIDYEAQVISVRQGRLMTREEKGWHLQGLKKEARNRLCVEEPFNTERNLGNSADDFAWRGIHLEIRRAFDLLADGQQLDKTCEQYEFPSEEKTVFKRPTPAPRPVLTHSTPGTRGGRGGSNHRGGRGGMNQKGNYGRRASSSASLGNNRPPFLNSPPITMPGPDYFPPPLNEHLHDQLYQQYQILEMRSNSLRAQLAAQQRQQAQHAQAQQVQAAQIHAQAIAQAQTHAQAHAHNRGQSSANGSPQKSPFVNGRSSPHMSELGVQPAALPLGFLYQYPGFFDPTQGSAPMSQDGSRTNPSSPSLTNSVPGLRRTVHRSSNASDTGSIRSQSQPARVVPQPTAFAGYPPIPQYFDPSAFPGYPIARSTQDMSGSQAPSEAPYSPKSTYTETAASSDHGTPKEYVGYYVAEQPQTRLPLQEYTVQQIPSYNELAQRRKRVSPEITQPLLNTALRRVSRSPSPLGGHVRSYSTSVAPQPAATAQPRKDRIDSTQPPDKSGPVIVNGSFPTQPRESRNRSETVDALPSADAANPTALGIYVNNSESYPMSVIEQRQQFVFEEIQRQKAAEYMRSGIINGSGNNTSPVELPSLPESWKNYDIVNGDQTSQSTEVSPTRTQLPQWRSSAYTNGLSPLDTLNAPRAPPQEVKSAGLPLLSPVFETRTPSPISSRQPDASKLVNGVKTQSKENSHPTRRTSHTPSSGHKENGRGNQQKGNGQHSEKGEKITASNSSNAPSTWQQSSQKKRRKAKPKQNEARPTGEPLPANTADRKGG